MCTLGELRYFNRRGRARRKGTGLPFRAALEKYVSPFLCVSAGIRWMVDDDGGRDTQPSAPYAICVQLSVLRKDQDVQDKQMCL